MIYKEIGLDLSTYFNELLKAPTLSDMAAVACNLQVPEATQAEAKVLYKRLRGYIDANDHRNAVASVLALLRHDGSLWIARIRRDGLFRASRYGYDVGCLKKIVGTALKVSTTASLPSKQIQYLESVHALLELARPAKQIHRGIVERLKARKSTALKTLLAFVNFTFSSNLIGSDQSDGSHLQNWSATEFASAFSRLYMIARDDIGINAFTWIWTDDLAASPHESIYSSLLMDALRLNELIDAEVLLDGLPYKAEATPDGVLVSAINPDFERSVRLGYIQSDLQLQIRAMSSLQHLGERQSEIPSLEDALAPFIDAGLMEFVSLKKEPFERIVIEVPGIPPLIELLNFNGLFLEEFPLFHGALIDNFQPPENDNLQVSEHLSIMDLFKAQRLFDLIDVMFCQKLEALDDPVKSKVLRLRSTVMVTARADLEQILQFVMSLEKAQELISLLSLPATSSAKGSDVYIDLQYRPFVHSPDTEGNYIAIPPAIVAKSNLLRSIMHSSGIKRATSADDDPMQVAVAAALREAGFLVQESFEFNINGRRETDIFCYREGVLFVIECKNAYHPCSPHELRNSYDLVLKAEEQLDIRSQWLAKPGNQMRLLEALSWKATVPTCVRTCIVTANRAFNGSWCGVHPVRQAHELINVLVDGHIGLGPGKSRHRFWRSENFKVTDLLDYLDGKSVLQMQHAAMTPTTREITLKDRRLKFAQFAMDLEDARRLTEESFDVIHDAKA